MGEWFFRDGPRVAQAVGTLTIHAGPCRLARGMQVRVADGVEWGGCCANALHGLLDVVRDLVGADEQDDMFRPEGDARNSVANHVQVDELPLAGEGVGPCDE